MTQRTVVAHTAAVEGRAAATVFSVGLLAAVLWPIRENWRTAKTDSFPLSYYPMFTERRGKRVRVTHLVGFGADETRHLLAYHHVGSGGLNQVRKHIRRAVECGEADAMCARLARSAAGGGLPLVSVAIITGEYQMARWFAGDRRPRREEVHAVLRCGDGAVTAP